MDLIDPSFGVRLIVRGGWLLAGIGALKVVIYFVGELFPGVYGRLKSDGLRRFLTGNGNRLVFGLGGFLTVILGLVFVILGLFVGRLMLRI